MLGQLNPWHNANARDQWQHVMATNDPNTGAGMPGQMDVRITSRPLQWQTHGLTQLWHSSCASLIPEAHALLLAMQPAKMGSDMMQIWQLTLPGK
jgi:hypothetical protein